MYNKNHIIIVGGGITGLTMALALGRRGISVTVLENHGPPMPSQESLDSRTVALNGTSQRILENLQVWQYLPAERLGLLRGLCVWDSLGGGEIHFDSDDVGSSHLGYIIENRELIAALLDAVHACPAITYRHSVEPQAVAVTENTVQLTLSDASELTGTLLIGADGGKSWLRTQMRVRVTENHYQQNALVAIAESEKLHQQTAWQNFLATGPLAFLPLFDLHQGAIIWSADVGEYQRLMQLSTEQLNEELTQGLQHRLGKIRLVTPSYGISLTERHADNYIKPRLVLIGDAAHTIHPLAGQGANLGLMDAACLAAAIEEAQARSGDLGGWRVLRRYERWRSSDNRCMAAMMSGFKTIFAQKTPSVIYLRSLAFNSGDQLTFIKRWMMRQAAGERGEVPPLAKNYFYAENRTTCYNNQNKKIL